MTELVRIEVRGAAGNWTSIDIETAAAWVQSANYVHSYDQIGGGLTLKVIDLAVPAFLDAAPNFKKIKGLGPDINAKIAFINERLRAIPPDTNLWDWPDSSENHEALRALFESARLPGFGPAVITKLLHRKRPNLIPIIDSWVRETWLETYRPAWTFVELADITFKIASELGRRHDQLEVLQQRLAKEGPPWSELTPLRLYDITAWECRFRGHC